MDFLRKLFGQKPTEDKAIKDKDSSHPKDKVPQAGDSTIGPLIKMLKGKDQTAQITATQSLAKIGAPAVGPLIAALKGADNLPSMVPIGVTLAEIGVPAANSLLEVLMDEDNSDNVRMVASKALEEIKDKHGPLIPLQGDVAAEGKKGQKENPIDRLTIELIEIYRTDGFLFSDRDSNPQSRSKFNKRARHIRGIEIGEELNRLGGTELMETVAYEVIRVTNGFAEGQFRYMWDGVGRWMA